MTTSHDSETPAENQQVITACALIHENINGEEKIFLPKRAATKKFLPGVFELPGGHIDFGEEITEGLAREIKEEFGAEVSIGDPFYIFTYINPIKGSHSVEIVYFAKLTSSIDAIILNPEDHSEYKWIAENELDQVQSLDKEENDPEFQALKKAFHLLKGESLNFG